MKILGINWGHNSSAVLLINGEIAAACEEEKLNRQKGFTGYPFMAIEYVLNSQNLKKSDVQYLAVASTDIFAWAGFSLRAMCLNFSTQEFRLVDKIKTSSNPAVVSRKYFPNLPIINRYTLANRLLHYIIQIIKRIDFNGTFNTIFNKIFENFYFRFLAEEGFKKNQILNVDHHLCHAASVYYCSPWENSLIFTSDGHGDGICQTFFLGKNKTLTCLNTQPDIMSIGQFYSAATKAMGFKPNRHEGKITGLAAHGDPQKCYQELSNCLKINNGIYSNLLQEKLIASGNSIKYFKQNINTNDWITLDNVYNATSKNRNFIITSQNFVDLFRKKLQHVSKKDLAATVQKIAEELTVKYVNHYKKQYPEVSNLCLAGGVFANVRINQKISEIEGVNNIFVQPAMGDEGTALGAAFWLHLEKGGSTTNLCKGLETVYLGPRFNNIDIENELKRNNLIYKKHEDIEKEIARHIHEGKIIGRFNGATEWGPRALGNRSILASASDPNINQTLNERLKRTEFMPFAPSVIDIDTKLFFKNFSKNDIASRYMTMTYDVKEKGEICFPAAVHLDRTARPQVVYRKQNPSYYKILEEYRKISGFGVIINTSFNLHEEPIVCTPYDAIRAFIANAVDILAIGPFLVNR